MVPLMTHTANTFHPFFHIFILVYALGIEIAHIHNDVLIHFNGS